MKLTYGNIGAPGDDGDLHHEQVQLFDLAADPTESTNVASEHPNLVAEMLERLSELERTAIPPHVNPNVLEGNPNLNGGFFGTGWCELSK